MESKVKERIPMGWKDLMMQVVGGKERDHKERC